MVPVWTKNNGITETLTLAEAAKHPKIREEIQTLINGVNTLVSNAEQIKKFEILDVELTEASGHLTPSLKIKRAAVLNDFSIYVDRIYN